MTTKFSLVALGALLLSLGLDSGCHSAASQGTAVIDTSKVPEEIMPYYESFAVNCSKCHGLSRALNAPVTNVKYWDLYVAKMMRTAGSAISPKDEPKILRFLYWYTRNYDKAVELDTGGAPAPVPAPTHQPERSPAPAAATPPQPGPVPASKNVDAMQTQAGEGP